MKNIGPDLTDKPVLVKLSNGELRQIHGFDINQTNKIPCQYDAERDSFIVDAGTITGNRAQRRAYISRNKS